MKWSEKKLGHPVMLVLVLITLIFAVLAYLAETSRAEGPCSNPPAIKEVCLADPILFPRCIEIKGSAFLLADSGPASEWFVWFVDSETGNVAGWFDYFGYSGGYGGIRSWHEDSIFLELSSGIREGKTYEVIVFRNNCTSITSGRYFFTIPLNPAPTAMPTRTPTWSPTPTSTPTTTSTPRPTVIVVPTPTATSWLWKLHLPFCFR